ncbi:ketopantoate reductase PanE/ApbA C terminal-domain-containing protein [Colletotrichum godetiae]|uniref:Ketopantoate reductase PanE/ApbA C terminal-domain-containing protein n=1 Tax=Colletotrichum godetiae TaxID=1209918 RepID=A0AAJ0AIP6_9PEZI|nr:ketopantoate reductase PanE/ApbA C terminal-domain-containing protein [Colletotrichum godetiae]KAK1674621.1 ketopantoate reductase PanE/ApbA C terminal-domain-containing protein [Colletotrichum godetiae]
MAPVWLQPYLSHMPQKTAPKLYAWSLSNLEENQSVLRSSPGRLDGSISHQQHRSHQQRIYVLGVGNLGILFASSLASLPNSPPITLVVHRKDLLLSWRQQPGIEVTRGDSTQRYLDFDVELWSEEEPSLGPAREVADGQEIPNLIVTTKASQALPQVDRARRYLNDRSTVAFAQNGMCKLWPPHGDSYMASRFPGASASHPNWLACVTTHGVTSLGQFKSLHASEADLKVGLVSPNNSADNASYLSNLLAESPHLNGQVVARDELWILQLEKLVVNSVINPLTAILRCKNGDLFTKKDGTIANIIDFLLMEASNILKALIQDRSVGVILQTAPGMALATEDEMTRKIGRRRRDLLGRFSHKKLKEMLYSVGHKVRENTSSMLQDVRAGKPTEVNEFNGWLVEMAAYLEGRIDVVHHKNLVDLVENNTVLSEESLGKHFSSLTDNRQGRLANFQNQ